MSSSDEDSAISDSEILEYKEKPYKQLKNGELKVKVNGILRCPFCAGKKKQEYKYKELYQHASGVAKGSVNRNAKEKANHLALAQYLTSDLADEAESLQPVVSSKNVHPTPKGKDLFVWPWMGIAVRKVKELKEKDVMMDRSYWLKKLVNFQPSEVRTFWIEDEWTVQVVLRFNNGWNGFKNMTEFEKSFESENRGRKDWNSQRAKSIAITYGWCAKADDYASEGPIGEYLRRKGRLRTASEVQKQEAENRNVEVKSVTEKIVQRNNDLDELQEKYVEKAMCLARMLEEKDKLHEEFVEETTKMQQLARDNVCRIWREQENLHSELEAKKRKISHWSKELNQREAVTEHEKRMLEKEKLKNESTSNSLHLASVEQRKADQTVLRLIEEQKREKEEALNKILHLEKQLDAKQKLDMEIEDLKGKINVMKHRSDKDDAAVKSKLEELIEELNDKTDDLDNLESLNSVLTSKERESNDELQEARQVWIKGLADHCDGRTKIGLKRMGEVDLKAFVAACKKRFPPKEAMGQAAILCSLWQENLKDPAWHPFKVISSNGTVQEIVNEEDEKLASLKTEWGDEIYDAVVTALKELNEYNPSGRYVIPELWHSRQRRKATLKEVVSYVIENINKGKRKLENAASDL